jgi:hypothetical protein
MEGIKIRLLWTNRRKEPGLLNLQGRKWNKVQKSPSTRGQKGTVYGLFPISAGLRKIYSS